VQELAFYRQTLFVPQPGPSLDEARIAANAILNPLGGQVD
jgi:oligoribonuclease